MHQGKLIAALAAFAVVAAGGLGYIGPSLQAGAPPGYQIQLVAEQWSAPVGAVAGPAGELFVAEAGVSSGTKPRVVKLGPDKKRTIVAADFPAPLTGLTMHSGKLYVSYVGGVDVLDPATGVHHPILSKLPAHGDHANTAVVFGPDGKLYFGLGTATNAGVVGEDNIRAGWVKAHPDTRDIPCKDVTVRGRNFTIANPLTPEPHDMAATGAFSPFGKTTARLQVIKAGFPCTGSVLRANPDGTGLELVAWGLRYPRSLAVGPDGQLYTTMQGYQDRGSRPVVGDVDYLYRIEQDRWYGWPDFAGGRSVTEETFQKPSFPISPLLARVPEQPPAPVATFPPGSGASGLLFPPASFGLRGDALAALHHQVVLVNPRSGKVTDFAQKGSWLPISLAPGPGGSVLVVDMGAARPSATGLVEPVPGAGRIWRISSDATSATARPNSRRAGVQWQWALVGLVLSVAGIGLVRKKENPNQSN